MFDDIIEEKSLKDKIKQPDYILDIYDNGKYRDTHFINGEKYTNFSEFVKSVEQQCETEKQQGLFHDYSLSVNDIEGKVTVDVHLKFDIWWPPKINIDVPNYKNRMGYVC